MTYRIVKIVGYCRGQLLSINVNIPAVFRKVLHTSDWGM